MYKNKLKYTWNIRKTLELEAVFVYSRFIVYQYLKSTGQIGLRNSQEEISMGTVGIIVVYAVILGGMWFLLMRPQKKEQKRIQAMLADMEIGDTALTTSGFYGVIIDITDDDVIVEFGNNKNCRIPMQKAAIAQIEKPGAE